ncbi:hypothetical protein CAC42_2010 [Sphaceloma murrayae]|uniref:Helicase SEN1 n=1 Tax=Sphaceloma murrayae TaxID=2082308 RepID=A0A2K1QIK1_9PEZI|nr:hypothetical protein CAC42_2010 [Sphaceloma murrayae]
MAELIGKIQELIDSPPEIHWFCPREKPEEDQIGFFDQDVDTEDDSPQQRKERKIHIEKALERRDAFIEAVHILGYNGEDALPYQGSLKDALATQLSRCTICIREYHKARSHLEEELNGQFPSDAVELFMERYDAMNIDRIKEGLEAAKNDMLDLPPSDRKISKLSNQALFALLESMHCMPFLVKEDLVQGYFDEAFRLVQSKKRITLPDYSPALTIFLFSDNEMRLDFALRCWAKMSRGLQGAEFDWTVKDQLSVAMKRVTITALDRDFMPSFWRGVRIIVGQLDRNVIAHHLRAMDIDLCKLALDHLQVDSPCFKDLLDTLEMLYAKAPDVVWDALGAISPQTVVEQIFNSPNMTRLMRATTKEDDTEMSDSLSWIAPFINSLKPGHAPNACRSLLHQTWTNYQKADLPDAGRRVCRLAGLRVLSTSFEMIQSAGFSAGSAIASLLDVLKPHLRSVLGNIERPGMSDNPIFLASLNIVQQAIAADVLLLAIDREAVKRKQPLALESDEASTDLWRTSIRAVKPGSSELAAAIMQGCHNLLALDRLPSKDANASKEARTWTQRLSEKHEYLSDLFNQMQDFSEQSLDVILKDTTSAEGLLSLLFAGDRSTQQSAAAMIKVVTAQDSRSDAVRALVERSFIPALRGLSEVLGKISSTQVFGAAQMTLRVGKDFISALCDSQDGLLRSRSLSSEDMKAVEHVWQMFWKEIKTIFDSTEQWALMGHDKELMISFCRDAMDFANQTFDVYSVISGALHQSADEDNTRLDTDQRLLEAPAESAASIVKWFRLRDEYLINKAIDLACKIMGRLRDVQVELPATALSFIEQILSDTIKNKVPANLKALLRRSLDIHVEEVLEPAMQKPTKQGTIAGWASSGSTTPSSAVLKAEKTKKGGINLDAWKEAAGQRKDVKPQETERSKILDSATSTFNRLKEEGQFKSSRPPPPQSNLQFKQQDDEKAAEFRRRRQKAMDEKKRRDDLAIAKAKRAREGLGDAGSGLSGIGVEGKDHTAAKGEGVMVSSDESDDDDEGGLDADLFGSGPKVSKKKTAVRMDANGAIGLKPEVKPTRITRVTRTKKDMRARLAPNLNPLHKIILGWDFFHQGDYPPGSEDWQFRKVSNTFRHVEEYRDTFRPLLTLEAWQGMVRSREEENSKPYSIKIASRSNVDTFIEISTSITHAELREAQLSEGDIILLSTASKPTNDKDAPNCLARVDKVRRKGKTVEVGYKAFPTSTSKAHNMLKPGAEIFGAKVQSIIPLEREYGSIAGLEFYDLCDEIVKARPSPLLKYTDKQLDPLIANYNVNKAQAKAIRSALDNDAFTLIQGPPGSGKTKTIVAIVGALLSDTLSTSIGTTAINRPGQNSSTSTSKKLLVCAPSNAAVDELVMRFKDGVKTTRGADKKINVLRLGRGDAVNSAVQDVTLEELVNKKMGTTNGDNNARQHTQTIMMEHKKISEALREARDKMGDEKTKGDDKSQLQDEINNLRKRKNELGTQIDTAKDAENAAGRDQELKRKQVQKSIIDESHIICATLSGSGHDMFQSLDVEFETVVVDEAAQCVEMSALIPLKYGCAKCILVGDPKQLPPTVFSKEAARFQYEQSLFVRMQGNHPDAVHLLDTQYRMHPDISSFPSASFYDGRLLDGADMDKLRERPWHKSALLAPYRFFDVQGQHESAPKGHSLVNKAEIQAAMSLYSRLTQDHPDYDFDNKIGIITPYKSQLRMLKDFFVNRYGEGILEKVEFNTTDAFQGRESEIIIFSCVRASPAGGIGFLQDIRRMNVGLTRAKCSLWVLGNSQSLIRGVWWKKLVEDAQTREVYTTGDVMGMLRQPSKNFPATKPAARSKMPEGATENVTAPVRPKAVNGKLSDSPRPTDIPMFKTDTSTRRHSGNYDKMEGVKVKAVDKIAGVKRERQSEDRMDIDIKEEEQPAIKKQAVDDVRSSETPRSRTATPGAPGSLGEARAGSDNANGYHDTADKEHKAAQKRASIMPTVKPSGPPPKRKAPSVFMPKKKK